MTIDDAREDLDKVAEFVEENDEDGECKAAMRRLRQFFAALP